MLLDEGVVCEGNSPLAYPGLSSLQNELTNRLQVGKSENLKHQRALIICKKTNKPHQPTTVNFQLQSSPTTHPQAT